jgi:hypothetical protein
VVSGGESWSGFQPDKLSALAAWLHLWF